MLCDTYRDKIAREKELNLRAAGWIVIRYEVPRIGTTTAGAVSILRLRGLPYKLARTHANRRPECWTTPEGWRAIEVATHAARCLVYASIPEAARRLVHYQLFDAFDAALRLIGDDFDALYEFLAPARKPLRKSENRPKISACAPVPRTKRSKRIKTSSSL